MSRSIVLKSFADLAEVLDLTEPAAEGSQQPCENRGAEPCLTAAPRDLVDLLQELDGASLALEALAKEDQEARTLALRDLERYDAAVARQSEAELAQARARRVRLDAEVLADAAFTGEARAKATGVARLARQAEDAAARVAGEHRAVAERLAVQLDLERLLAERRRQEEADKAKAVEAARAARLSGALAAARAALAAGRIQEAKAALEAVAGDNQADPEIAALRENITARELAVRIATAAQALRAARREYRRRPEEAVARLEGLDLGDIPAPLAAQVFGEWARACSRICRERRIEEPLRYAPEPGRGAVIARESAGSYVVVRALGMGLRWQAGSLVDERQVRRARPLR